MSVRVNAEYFFAPHRCMYVHIVGSGEGTTIVFNAAQILSMTTQAINKHVLEVMALYSTSPPLPR